MDIEIEIVNVRLPSEIVKWLDSLIKAGIYNSRSEAVREFCREFVSRKKGANNE